MKLKLAYILNILGAITPFALQAMFPPRIPDRSVPGWQYTMFNVSQTANASDIKKAAGNLLKLYHPDKIPSAIKGAANIAAWNKAALAWSNLALETRSALLDPAQRTIIDNAILAASGKPSIPATAPAAGQQSSQDDLTNIAIQLGDNLSSKDPIGFATNLNTLLSTEGGRDFAVALMTDNSFLDYNNVKAQLGLTSATLVANTVFGTSKSGKSGDPISSYLYQQGKLTSSLIVETAAQLNAHLTAGDLASAQADITAFTSAGGDITDLQILFATGGPLDYVTLFADFPAAATNNQVQALAEFTNTIIGDTEFDPDGETAQAYAAAAVADPITSAIYQNLDLKTARIVGPKLNAALESGDLVTAINIVKLYNESYPDDNLSFLIVGPEAPLNITNIQDKYPNGLIVTTAPGHDSTTIGNNLTALATAIAGANVDQDIDPALYSEAIVGVQTGSIQITGGQTINSKVIDAASILTFFTEGFQAPRGTVPAASTSNLIAENPSAFRQAYSAAIWTVNDMLENGILVDPDGKPITAESVAEDPTAFQDQIARLCDIFLEGAGYVMADSPPSTFAALQAAAKAAGYQPAPTGDVKIPAGTQPYLSTETIPNAEVLAATQDAAALLIGIDSYPEDPEEQAAVEEQMELAMYGTEAEAGWYNEIEPIDA
ncbi:MAG TPA: J domain-containing protein [Candidatus Babeliales bacterium]|nr:J domain-containing protein [Candidatus Babeliales bacterium]